MQPKLKDARLTVTCVLTVRQATRLRQFVEVAGHSEHDLPSIRCVFELDAAAHSERR